MVEVTLYVVFLALAILSVWMAVFQLKIRRDVQKLFNSLASPEVQKLFENSADDAYRRHEVRIKAIEAEWEDVYNKFDRLAKRRDGEKGGRPPKSPDTLPLDSAGPVVLTKEQRRAQILRQGRGRA